MSEFEFLKRIEELRDELHQLAELHGLHAPLVMEKSQKLDDLLNSYNRIKVSTTNDALIFQ